MKGKFIGILNMCFHNKLFIFRLDQKIINREDVTKKYFRRNNHTDMNLTNLQSVQFTGNSIDIQKCSLRDLVLKWTTLFLVMANYTMISGQYVFHFLINRFPPKHAGKLS